MRVMSLNLFGHHGGWPARRELLTAGLRRLRPDVVALQEAVVDDTDDQAAELLGAGYHLAHQTLGLVGDGRHHGTSVASRIEELAADDPAHVVVGGDFNATPDSSS